MTLSKILIIDDDKIVSQIVQERLKKDNVRIKILHNPLEAMELIRSYRPDIILLDVVMPGISGFELLELIRSEFSAFELPVLMMTAKSEDEEVIRALKLEANDYLIKPFSMEVAQARIDVQMRAVLASRKQLEIQQLQTVKAMIATYNHEINNPLAIASGYLDRDFDKLQEKHIESVKKSLSRITEIVKKISDLAEEDHLNTKDYVNNVDMINLESENETT